MKLAAIIVLVAVLVCPVIEALASTPENPPAASISEARELLRESFDLSKQKRLEEAEALVKRVIAFDPKFRAEYPDEKMNLHAMARLAHIYYQKGEWQKALDTYELAEQIVQEQSPDSDSTLPSMMARCRKKLAELGALNTESAMITVRGSLLSGGGTVRNGVTLVPVSGLADLLNLEVKMDGQTAKLCSTRAQRTLILTSGSNSALLDGRSIILLAAPQRDGESLLVPLRAVAESFGAKVTWESLPRIARVF